MPERDAAVLRLGVSSCLLGEEVRWNAGHKRDRYITDTLGPRVEWVPLCPEADVGMGVPRPTVRLEGPTGAVRMVAPKTGEDWTERMQGYAEATVAALPDLDGFVLQKGSPSCGPFAVKRYDPQPVNDGVGLFAAELLRQRPWMAVIDEGRLHADMLRWGFLDHAMWNRRWRDADPQGGKDLMDLHRDHKLTLLSHDPGGAKRLGPMASGEPAAYRAVASDVLRTAPTTGRMVDALQHAAGFLRGAVTDTDRQELAEAITDYQKGTMPLLVPLTLLRHHARRDDVPAWLRQQTFLDPYPKEWVLRG